MIQFIRQRFEIPVPLQICRQVLEHSVLTVSGSDADIFQSPLVVLFSKSVWQVWPLNAMKL